MLALINKLLLDFFENEKIKYFASLEACSCTLLYPAKLPEYTSSVVFFAIPYFVRDNKQRNISLYAVPRDYHLYIKELSERFEAMRLSRGLSFEYRFFADNSPFSERICAEKCGIGKRGKNGVIITPEYGSFVFIGSICLSHDVSISHTAEKFNSDLCENCEKCISACPMHSGKCDECLSAITQKKKLCENQAEIIASHPIKWGCDICQLVCPYNKDIPDTPIDFFKQYRIPFLTESILDAMTDEEFSARAYSWRKREVIKRNLLL